MLVDMDTSKLKLKKGDMLVFDGKKMSKINQDELLKPLNDEIKKLKKDMEIQDNKRKEFVKSFKGAGL